MATTKKTPAKPKAGASEKTLKKTPAKKSATGAQSAPAKGRKSFSDSGLSRPITAVKNLVIVESPAKGKTIEKFLDSSYRVEASFGHIRDLPSKNMGVDIAGGFVAQYEISDDKKKRVSELKKLASMAEHIYLATDEDREGEAIAWHLCQALGINEKTTDRIVFHEITKTAILKALESPRKVDINLVNAQQSRRILDRIVGYEISPVLWNKIKRGLSAGRVQSVAVKLIVEREREIMAFKPEESWRLTALLDGETLLPIEFTKISNKVKKISDQNEARNLLTEALGIDNLPEAKEDSKKKSLSISLKSQADFTLSDVEVKENTRYPAAPFTTSTLQQEASRRLGFSTSQTMSVAQVLYQNGHITYMRTDSVNLSKLALDNARETINAIYGKEYSLPNGRQYKTKSASAQEAHEAIRPTRLETTPEAVRLDGNEMRLYRLIWERTIASQMQEALVESTTYTFTPKNAPSQSWVAKGEVIKFAGFMKLYIEATDDEEGEDSKRLPAVTKWSTLTSSEASASQLFSRPPARYSEALLVKKLESEGIGRPSTYAPTITTIVDRGYVEKIEKRLAPTDIAFTVTDFLEKEFTDMVQYDFTARVEGQFDEVAEGKVDYVEMLSEFYKAFHPRVEAMNADKSKVIENVGRKCPKCNEGDLIYKFSKSGRFIGCNKYPECDYLERIKDEKADAKMDAVKAEWEGKPCPAGGTIVVKSSRFWVFLSSSLYPEVKWITNPVSYALDMKWGGATCDVCNKGILHVKSSRKGPFLACDAYPECKNAKPLPKEAKEDSKVEGAE